MKHVLVARKGTTVARLLTLRDTDGAALSAGVYTGADSLSATIRPAGGFVESAPSLGSPLIAWDDASAAEILLTIRSTDLATIPPGEYRLLVNLTKSGESAPRPVLDAILVVKGA